MQVVDSELWVRTKDQIKSYINVHEEAISDGWFKTGDLVECAINLFQDYRAKKTSLTSEERKSFQLRLKIY